ncbi:MAG: hypothetical protein Q4C99_00550 [Clostridia bacterium]|nr:hypothetical protein [Clostridia bacterium]
MKKILAILLSVIMMFTTVPIVVYAQVPSSTNSKNIVAFKDKAATQSTEENYSKDNGTSKKVLLIQTSQPWRTTSNTDILKKLVDTKSIDEYSQITMSNAVNRDFTEYNVVILANDQEYSSYKEYSKIKKTLEKYITSGGVVLFGACDEGWSDGSFDVVLPGDVTKYSEYVSNNYISDASNPFVKGEFTNSVPMTNNMLHATYCSHTSFNEDTLPLNSNVILRSKSDNAPTLVKYNYGNGIVLASGLTWEFAYQYDFDDGFGDYYDDLILYSLSLSNSDNEDSSYDISSNFKIGKDNNSFCHSKYSSVFRTAGFVGVKDYKIDKEYYKGLVNNSSLIEKIQIKKIMNSVWEGSCYGIATTLGMVYQSIIPLSSITSKSNVKDYYHLPYPYKDKALLNSIQYFQLSQNLKKGGKYDSAISLTVSNNNLKNKEYDYDNLRTFLKKLVKQASNGKTTLFGFTYKEDGDISGHAILIIGCKYDSENKRYIVKLYDENSVDDDSKGNFDKLIISSDFRKFYWSNEHLSNETYLQMYFLDWSRMKQLDGSAKASRQAKEMTNLNQTELTFSLDDSFEIVNSSGENLKYDGGDFSGDMNVYSFNVDSNGINSSCNATVSIDSSDYYTVYSPTGNVDFQLSDDTDFVSLSAESASNIEVSLENGIEFDGNNSPFIAYMNTDELVAENETNLISVSGVVNGKTVITENNNIVKATNENGIKDAQISNYVETDENTIKYDKDKVSIDSSDLSNKNNGGGGGAPAPTPTTDEAKNDDEKQPETKPNQSQNTSTSAAQKLNIKKLVSKKKALVVYWNKITDVSGYQIQVATDKKFKRNRKTVTVAKQNASKKAVKKLKAKKKYYVRVRTYKIVNGKKVYGKWSKIKYIKTK